MIADLDSSWAQSYSFVPPGHMGPAWTVLVVLGLLGAGYGSVLVAGASLWLGLRRARADEHAMLDGGGRSMLIATQSLRARHDGAIRRGGDGYWNNAPPGAT